MPSCSRSGASEWVDYVGAGGAMLGMRVLSGSTVTTRYFHTDNLGSIAVITDTSGNVVERDGYDAWGKRRFPTGADDPTDSITSQTMRGFTGQEELADVGLVHLNGRVYDPFVAPHDERRPDGGGPDERPSAGTATATSPTTRSPSPTPQATASSAAAPGATSARCSWERCSAPTPCSAASSRSPPPASAG